VSPLSSADADAPEAEAPGAEAPDGEPDEQGEQATDQPHRLVQALAAELGDDVVAQVTQRGDTWLRVRRDTWRRTAETCRKLGFDYFCFLSAIDWAPATSQTRGEVAAGVEGGDEDEAEPGPTGDQEAAAYASTTGEEESAGGPGAWETGVAGGETRFQVLARLYSTRERTGVTLKADLDDEAPAVESWSQVYAGADWHERETGEMFGIDFVGHPNLTHIYLPGEFEGFPLRKDFPLLSREVKPWPGLVDVEPMPGEGEEAEAAAGEGGDS
jgi:NADH-quinone oxidoreductase subunit C